MTDLTYNLIGHWLATKYRDQAQTSSTYQAALNLRKAGVPLWLARLILLGR